MLIQKPKLILIFSLISILISCASVSSPTGEKEAAASFQSIESVQPQWEPLANGIGFFYGRVAEPKIEFWALRIDLDEPYLQIVVKAEPNTVSGFVRDNNLIAGINATPFDTNRNNVGLVVSNRVILSERNNNYDALVFYKEYDDTRVIITRQADIYSTDNIHNAVGGFHQILKDGQPTERTLRTGTVSAERHPRSAAGVSAGNNVLFLLVVDGKRSGSVGVTENETALLLKALGSNDGLNLDGGGSTTLAVRDADGIVRTLNKPSDFGRERVVGGSLGVRSTR